MEMDVDVDVDVNVDRGASSDTEARERVAFFFRQAAGNIKGGKVWIQVGDEHRIVSRDQPLPADVRVIARFTKLTADLEARILIAAVWPGREGAVGNWVQWMQDRIAAASGWAEEDAVRSAVEGVASSARARNVDGMVAFITAYYECVETARRTRDSIWDQIAREDSAAEDPTA